MQTEDPSLSNNDGSGGGDGRTRGVGSTSSSSSSSSSSGEWHPSTVDTIFRVGRSVTVVAGLALLVRGLLQLQGMRTWTHRELRREPPPGPRLILRGQLVGVSADHGCVPPQPLLHFQHTPWLRWQLGLTKSYVVPFDDSIGVRLAGVAVLPAVEAWEYLLTEIERCPGATVELVLGAAPAAPAVPAAATADPPPPFPAVKVSRRGPRWRFWRRVPSLAEDLIARGYAFCGPEICGPPAAFFQVPEAAAAATVRTSAGGQEHLRSEWRLLEDPLAETLLGAQNRARKQGLGGWGQIPPPPPPPNTSADDASEPASPASQQGRPGWTAAAAAAARFSRVVAGLGAPDRLRQQLRPLLPPGLDDGLSRISAVSGSAAKAASKTVTGLLRRIRK